MSRTVVLTACLVAGLLWSPAAPQENPAPAPRAGAGAGKEKWHNPVRQFLREGKPVIGGTVTVNSVDVAAQMANMGFDFLWVEMEHSPISWETFRNMVLATRGLKAMPFFRVPANEVWAAKRGLDAGALGVIFPFTRTPALARQAVASCKYPPEGRRGAGPGLASFRWQSADESYYEFANRNVMVICIIEDKSGVDHIDEIAAVPGVDVLFIGTNDLSWQLAGGDRKDPKVKAAIEKIVAAGKRHGKFLGRPAGTPAEMKQHVQEGFLFFQGPSELGLMSRGARQLLDPLGKKGFDPKTKSLY
ncbi:MAG: aldolase/citrate lyase family protein [Gemmataceae bacterium]|nr:aldolase/citrate lyase family protein [Gemmataceae bacterium]